MTTMGVDPALVERFRGDVLRLAPEVAEDGRLALAVSGGPDSMAMLVLSAAAFPGRVAAATVDHKLRPEAAGEAALVAFSCRRLDVPHTTLAIEVPPGASGNLHAWARQERYRLLKRWALEVGDAPLCTAHHAEDQAETFLMRAARASGLAGLSAVRARIDDDVAISELSRIEFVVEGAIIAVSRRPITLLRPLLHWRRSELRTIAHSADLAIIDDPSNRDPAFDRARFRKWLEQAEWIDPCRISRSAEYLAEAEADLRAIAEWIWRDRWLPAGDLEVRFDVAGIPRGVRRYMARLAIDTVQQENGFGHPERTSRSIEPLLDALDAGSGATHSGVQASADGTVWHFREAPPHRTR